MNNNARNNSLIEIAEVFQNSESVLLFPHVFADGDAIGSAIALCEGLRHCGKKAWVLIEDKIPDMYTFMTADCCVKRWTGEKPSVCVMLDCGEIDRIPGKEVIFMSGATAMCIDHHITSKPFLEWNYIDNAAAATAEIIYDLLILMKVEISKTMAEAIYAGIVTDTGRLQYENTTKRTLLIVAELFDKGLRPNEIAIELYQKAKLEKLFLEARVMESAVLFADGKAIISYVTYALLKETGALTEDIEGIVDKMRDIKDIEVSVLLKEIKDGFKISLRSKEHLDVAKISKGKGGGGHKRAAGFSVSGVLENVKNETMSIITKELEKLCS
jgi:phosphoesterase RecJ-like protein